LALQFVGRPFDEARLLAAAAWCEHALGLPPLTPGLSDEEAQKAIQDVLTKNAELYRRLA